MPPVIAGLTLSALWAADMSTACSMLIGCSTTVSQDIFFKTSMGKKYKDKAFIIYMKIIKNEIITNYDESQIKNLSKEEYNNSFRTILNYLDNIIK